MKALSATLIALAMAITSSTAELKVGDEAPDCELKGSDGKTYKFAELKGQKAIVIAWFPKVFTGG